MVFTRFLYHQTFSAKLCNDKSLKSAPADSHNAADKSDKKERTSLLEYTLEVMEPKSEKKSTLKPESINITYRKYSKKSESKRTEDLNKKKTKDEKKAKSKLKKDVKVAKALKEMAKHFAKVNIGTVGECEYIKKKKSIFKFS